MSTELEEAPANDLRRQHEAIWARSTIDSLRRTVATLEANAVLYRRAIEESCGQAEDIERLQKELAAFRTGRDDAVMRLAAMERSTFWRLTFPARKLAGRLKRLLSGRRP